MTTQKIKILGSLMALGGLAALASNAALADAHKAAMTAEEHAGFAAKGTDLATVHRHLHHVLNCLVGEKGNGFDAAAGNPCANAGAAIPETTDKKMMMKLEKAAKEARMGLADEDLAKAKKEAMQVQTTLK
jgi:hypothetical protein